MFEEWLQFPINFLTNFPIRKAMRIRDRLHKQAEQNSSNFLLRKYKAQRNKVNNMIKYAREQFFINANDMLDKNVKSNPKSNWKLVKKLMGNCNHTKVYRLVV
jgi:hypothetical protein